MIRLLSARAACFFFRLWLVSAVGALASRADEADDIYNKMRQQGIEAGVMLGDRQMVEMFGGVVGPGGEVFGSAEEAINARMKEWEEATGGTAGGDQAMMERAVQHYLKRSNGPAGVGGLPRLTPQNDASLHFEEMRRRWFQEKKAAALADLGRLRDRAADIGDATEGVGDSAADEQHVDYLPGVRDLLERMSARQSASKPTVGDKTEGSGVRFMPLAAWIAANDAEATDEAVVFGFIDPALLQSFSFVDTRGGRLDLQKYDSILGAGELQEPKKAAVREVVVRVSKAIKQRLLDKINELSITVASVREQRQKSAGKGCDPVSLYRWTFGQLLDSATQNYLPVSAIAPKMPRLSIALSGKGRVTDDTRTIVVDRFLLMTTPLPEQSNFIRSHGGRPAVLLDEDGVHEAMFFDGRMFCKDTAAWCKDRPALKRILDDRDGYLRSMLVATWADVDKMNAQLEQEVLGATCNARDDAFRESVIRKGLEECGVDSKELKSASRLFANGLGRRIADQTNDLFAGAGVAQAAVEKLADDRRRFATMIKDPHLQDFVAKRLLGSFLVVAIDHEHVSLCEFATALDLHIQYSMVYRRAKQLDGLSQACRIAELRSWVEATDARAIMPLNPKFSTLPESVTGKQEFLASLASVREARPGDRTVAPDAAVQEKQPADGAKQEFVFPGERAAGARDR